MTCMDASRYKLPEHLRVNLASSAALSQQQSGWVLKAIMLHATTFREARCPSLFIGALMKLIVFFVLSPLQSCIWQQMIDLCLPSNGVHSRHFLPYCVRPAQWAITQTSEIVCSSNM